MKQLSHYRTQIIISGVCMLYIIMYIMCPYKNCECLSFCCELSSFIYNFCISLLAGIIVYWLTTNFIKKKVQDIIDGGNARFDKIEPLLQRRSVSLMNEMIHTIDSLFENNNAIFNRIAHPNESTDEDMSYLRRIVIKLLTMAELLQPELLKYKDLDDSVSSIIRNLESIEVDLSKTGGASALVTFAKIKRSLLDLKQRIDNR